MLQNSYKLNKQKLYVIALFFICFIFYNFLPILGSDYNPYTFIFSIIFFFCYHKKFRINIKFIPFVILIIIVFICCFVATKTIAISEFLFWIVFFNVLLIKKHHLDLIQNLVKLALVFYLFLLLFEILFPDLYYFKKILFKSSSTNIFSIQGRGFYALDTEPSFFVLNIFSLWLILFSLNSFKPLSIFYNILILILLFSSLSVMTVIVIPIILFFSMKSKYLFILVLTSPLLINSFFSQTRIYNTIKGIFNYDFIRLIESDMSFSSRLYYIIKDIYLAYNSFFLPFGPGTYNFIQDFHFQTISNFFYLTKYDPLLPGSFLGYFIVQYGILIVIISFVIYINLLKYFSKIKSFFFLLSLVFVLLQQISLMFVPIIFALSIFYKQLQRTKIILS